MNLKTRHSFLDLSEPIRHENHDKRLPRAHSMDLDAWRARFQVVPSTPARRQTEPEVLPRSPEIPAVDVMKESERKVRAWLYNMHNPNAATFCDKLQLEPEGSAYIASQPLPCPLEGSGYITVKEHNRLVNDLRARCESLERRELKYRSLYKEAQDRYTTCLALLCVDKSAEQQNAYRERMYELTSPVESTVVRTPVSVDSTAVTIHRIPLNKEDFPNVKFWDKETWFLWRRSSELARCEARTPSKGENVSLLYVEDKDGNLIDGYRAAEIRRFAYSLFQRFKDEGVAPFTWGKASPATANAFAREMEEKFEELRYCERSWKAHAVATFCYPKWTPTHLRDRQSSRSDLVSVLKRTSQDLDEAPLKRLRVNQSAPLQMPCVISPAAVTPSDSPTAPSPGLFASAGSTGTADTSRTLIQEPDLQQELL